MVMGMKVLVYEADGGWGSRQIEPNSPGSSLPRTVSFTLHSLESGPCLNQAGKFYWKCEKSQIWVFWFSAFLSHGQEQKKEWVTRRKRQRGKVLINVKTCFATTNQTFLLSCFA